jgi:serine/threonine protein phosphatase PrpC
VSDTQVSATIYARTDLGQTREHNEDAFLVGDLTAGKARVHSEVVTLTAGPRGLLFLVADGMGGAAAGELASAMAADLIFGHLAGTWTKEPEGEISEQRFILRLREAVDLANLQIHAYAREHAEVRGMGTTATVAGVIGHKLFLAQVGDSRAYLVRGGRAVQITKDQSLMQRLVDAGELTEEEAETSTRRNIILQALGPDPRIRVEITFQTLAQGDVLVLCSDGLSGLVKRDEIAEALVAQDDLRAVAEGLVSTANARGGPDNITVVLAKFEGSGLPAAVAEETPAYAVYSSDEHPAVPEDAREESLPAQVPPASSSPARRTGSPAGMALLVIGALLVLLAAFLAFG